MPFVVSSGIDSPPPVPSPVEPEAPKAKSTAVNTNFKSQGLNFHICKIPFKLKQRLDSKNTSCDVQIRDRQIRVVVPLGKNVIFRTSESSFLMILQNGDVFVCSQPYTLEKGKDGQVDVFLKPSCTTTKEGIVQIDNCCKLYAGNFVGSEQRTASLNNRDLNPLFPSPRKQARSNTSVVPVHVPAPPDLTLPQTSVPADLTQNGKPPEDTVGDNLVVDLDQNENSGPPDNSQDYIVPRFISDEEIDSLLSIENVDELEEAAQKLYDKIQIEQYRNEFREKKKEKLKDKNKSSSQSNWKGVFSPLSEHLQAAKSINSPKKPKIKEKKKSDPSFLCTECGKLFNTKLDLAGHKRVHLGIRPFVCNTCGKRFHSYGLLSNHKLSHRPVKNKPFSCMDCKNKYATAESLEKHRLLFHSGGQKKVPPISPLRMCEQCGKYVRQKYLKKHLKKCGTISEVYANKLKFLNCEYCSAGPFVNFLVKRQHLLDEHKEKAAYDCPTCGKKYFKYYSFKSHRNLCGDPLNNMTRNCEFCPEIFPDIRSKRIHRKNTHSELATFECPECPLKFFSLYTMQTHKRKKHKKLNETRTIPNYKVFECSFCGTSHVKQTAYAKHLRWYHPGEYSYDCTFCGTEAVVTVFHDGKGKKERCPKCPECSRLMYMHIDE